MGKASKRDEKRWDYSYPGRRERRSHGKKPGHGGDSELVSRTFPPYGRKQPQAGKLKEEGKKCGL